MNLFPCEFRLPQFRPTVHKSVKSILHVMQILEAMGSACQDSKDLIPQGELKPKGEAVAVRITTASGYAVITNDVVTSSLSAVTSFGPCHRCHNNQSSCGRRKLKSRDTQQIKCAACGLEQPVCRNLNFNSCVIVLLCIICIF